MAFNHLRSLLLSAVTAYEPTHVRLVLIRRWFGPRWLGFAGKLMGAAGCTTPCPVVPPFNPHRVAAELDLRLPDTIAAGDRLHAWRTSEENTRRYMRGFGSNGTLAAWLSIPDEPGSRAHADNTRACLMVHFIAASTGQTIVEPIRWYVQCIQTDTLTLQPRNISVDELRWIQSHPAAPDIAFRAFAVRAGA